MKLGIITDGISRDPQKAFPFIAKHGLQYAELQFLWDKEVGELDEKERAQVRKLLKEHHLQTSCISRHLFGGISILQTNAQSDIYRNQLRLLKNCIQMAKECETNLVRIMSFRKEMILFGKNGAEEWNVAQGAWQKLIELIQPAVEIAEQEKITLVIETGNNGIVNSGYLAKKLVNEINSPYLQVLWDPANCCYAAEKATPDGWNAIKDILGHLHIKDVRVDIAKAFVQVCPLMGGALGEHFAKIKQGLQTINYQGTISLENVYHPDNEDYVAGFLQNIEKFQEIFQ